MGNLSDELKGVVQESPPADPPIVEKEKEVEEDEEKDRTAKEVRGELLRKQEKMADRFDAKFDALQSLVQEAVTAARTPVQEPKATSTNSLDDYSIPQLEIEVAKLSDDDVNKPGYLAYIQDRKVRELVKGEVSAFATQQNFSNERTRYTEMAVTRYPDLQNPTSDFARKVDQKLLSIPANISAINPRVVFDLSNEVAIDMEVKPQQRRTILGKPADTNTEPTEQKSEVTLMADEEREKLAKKLEIALPKGKKFDMDRLKEREKNVKENMIVIFHEETE